MLVEVIVVYCGEDIMKIDKWIKSRPGDLGEEKVVPQWTTKQANNSGVRGHSEW